MRGTFLTVLAIYMAAPDIPSLTFRMFKVNISV